MLEIFHQIIKIVTSKYILYIIIYLLFLYRGLPNKYPFTNKTDFGTSMIKGIIPDRYTLRQVQEQTEISDELKNNVRTMLFK